MKKQPVLIIISFLVCFFGQNLYASPGETIFSARQVFEAFKEAYPAVFGEIQYRNDDLAIQVRDKWFYWAHGRILPEGEQDRWEEFDAYVFYTYPKSISEPRNFTALEKQKMQETIAHMDLNPVARHPAFYDAIWRSTDYQTAYSRVKTIYFLGLKVEIHRDLLEDLARVEEEILEKAKNDPALQEYLKSLWQTTGFVWRVIAGTYSKSMHAYGTAVDILPSYYAHLQVYWRWSKQYYPEWYSLANKHRYFPHRSVIEAFEHNGFVWGGKWLFFDNIHFEYRPEILLLNGFKIPSIIEAR